MRENLREAPIVPASIAHRGTMRWAGTVIVISSAAVFTGAAVQGDWLTAAYFSVMMIYGALLRWGWPLVTRRFRIAVSVAVIASLFLVAAILWRDFF